MSKYFSISAPPGRVSGGHHGAGEEHMRTRVAIRTLACATCPLPEQS